MDNWRHLALEVMVTLSETASAMVRKHAGNFIAILVQQVLQMMTQLEDEDDWSVSDEIAEDDNDRYVIYYCNVKNF